MVWGVIQEYVGESEDRAYGPGSEHIIGIWTD